MNDFYSYSIDIWSVGCIFAELLSMMEGNFATFTERQPLFPGISCYPLSPGTASMSPEEKQKKKAQDQLGVIFSVIGTPSADDEELSSFLETDTINYVRTFP